MVLVLVISDSLVACSWRLFNLVHESLPCNLWSQSALPFLSLLPRDRTGRIRNIDCSVERIRSVPGEYCILSCLFVYTITDRMVVMQYNQNSSGCSMVLLQSRATACFAKPLG